eukprot:NODE_4483_length_336_cov_3.794425_g4039_i0.p3 GENE.NODE_4483_length_336_cov_3.794425_g4039_i0~~NODE_4483_length_336_cov_3.794425_g4039_i0.p3  ORF type:complete len:69 (+),score=14.30 NODE_4483_length_336_cov_3.794425_g4039_i0:3-209(+)
MVQFDTPLHSVETLKRTQELTNLPYVVIQGGQSDIGLVPAVSRKKRKQEAAEPSKSASSTSSSSKQKK